MLIILQDIVKGPKGHKTTYRQMGETLCRTQNGSSVRARWAKLQVRLEWVGVLINDYCSLGGGVGLEQWLVIRPTFPIPECNP